jgi:hypothetical protein
MNHTIGTNLYVHKIYCMMKVNFPIEIDNMDVEHWKGYMG